MKSIDFDSNGFKTFYRLLLWAILLISLCATGYGLSTISGFQQILSAFPGLKRFIMFSSVTLGGFWLIALKMPRHMHSIAIGLAVLLCFGSMGVAPLIIVAWIGLASYLLGNLFMGKVSSQSPDEAIDAPLQMVLGLGLYATIIGIAVHFKVNYPIVYLTLLAAPLFLSKGIIKNWFRGFVASGNLHNRRENPFLCGFAWYLAFIYLVTAAMPEVGFDALAMHLMIPDYIAHNHRWSFDFIRYIWAVMPMNGDWLFSLAYMLAGEYGSRLLNVGFLFVINWMIWCLAVRSGQRRIGLLAIIMFLSLPLTYLETGSLFVENVWTCFIFGAFLALIRYMEDGRREMLTLAGLISGFALAAKLTTIFVLPFFAIILAWHLFMHRGKGQNGKTLLAGIAAFATVGCIPYAVAYIKTGNPVFPFYNAIFKSPFFSSTANFDHKIFQQGLSLKTLYLMTFESGKYLEGTPGSLGFYFLALFPVALFIGLISRNKIIVFSILTGVGYSLFLFTKLSYLRYFYPAVPFLVLVMVFAVEYSEQISSRLRIALNGLLLLVIPLNLVFFMAANWNYRDFPVQIVLDNLSKGRFILERTPIRRAVEYLNTLPNQPESVAFFAQPVFAGLHSEILINNWYNSRFSSDILNAKSPDLLASLLIEEGASMIVLDENLQNKSLLAMLQEISAPAEKFGHISVRTISKKYQFQVEKILNPDFEGKEGWNFAVGSKYLENSGSVLVSVDSPVNQVVKVKPKGRYLLEVSARCTKGGEFRLQANWLDKKGKFISTDIDVANCSNEFVTKSKEVVAPERALQGVIYATSNNMSPVEIRRVSFK